MNAFHIFHMLGQQDADSKHFSSRSEKEPFLEELGAPSFLFDPSYPSKKNTKKPEGDFKQNRLSSARDADDLIQKINYVFRGENIPTEEVQSDFPVGAFLFQLRALIRKYENMPGGSGVASRLRGQLNILLSYEDPTAEVIKEELALLKKMIEIEEIKLNAGAAYHEGCSSLD